ncbi:MAG: PHB depolymerase family esterase [Dehalococcoidia bacterium]
MTGDGLRAYRLHVPPSYTGSDPVPLVLNIHGATSSSAVQESYTGFSAKADAEGFIVVYPEGVTTAGLPFPHFNAWQLASPEPNDVAFVNTLLDAIEAALCIEHARVFSTGLSNGAMMSVRLACSLPGRIAAIAAVAGAYYPPIALDLNAAETCTGITPVPILLFHGTSDVPVPFNGGFGGIPGLMITFRLPMDDNTPADDVLADWSAHNGCTAGRQESQIDTEVRLITYASCDANAGVQLYAVDGGGHTWPGAVDVPPLGYTTHQISANDLIWAFFSDHPLTLPSSVGGISEQLTSDSRPATAPSRSERQHAASDYALGAAGALVAVFALAAAAWRLRRKAPV